MATTLTQNVLFAFEYAFFIPIVALCVLLVCVCSAGTRQTTKDERPRRHRGLRELGRLRGRPRGVLGVQVSRRLQNDTASEARTERGPNVFPLVLHDVVRDQQRGGPGGPLRTRPISLRSAADAHGGVRGRLLLSRGFRHEPFVEMFLFLRKPHRPYYRDTQRYQKSCASLYVLVMYVMSFIE